ncbi:MAG: division/cell wall cluster transcriptional repressor MraZ [Prolixibacteraceae bacterium]
MIEFTGTYNATIDDKGRFVLPAAFKKEMGDMAGEPIVVQRNLFKKCLDIFPERFWKDRVDAFKSTLDPFDEEDDEFLQFFYETFTKVGMAANGRLNVPAEYLSFGSLKKSVRLIGMGRSIRMWDVEAYEENKMDKATFAKRFKEKRKKKAEDK